MRFLTWVHEIERKPHKAIRQRHTLRAAADHHRRRHGATACLHVVVRLRSDVSATWQRCRGTTHPRESHRKRAVLASVSTRREFPTVRQAIVLQQVLARGRLHAMCEEMVLLLFLELFSDIVPRLSWQMAAFQNKNEIEELEKTKERGGGRRKREGGANIKQGGVSR